MPKLTSINTSSDLSRLSNDTRNNINATSVPLLQALQETLPKIDHVRFKTVETTTDEKENYVSTGPDVLFAADYMVDKKLAGCLLVWEKYHNSTHYEVFRKDVISKKKKGYKRILFLTKEALEEETKRYVDYIRDELGIDVSNDVVVILDSDVLSDRLYQYKVKASRVPKSKNDIAFIQLFKSKGLLQNTVVASADVNVYDLSRSSLGNIDLAWTISLFNKIEHFGLQSFLSNLDTNDKVKILNDTGLISTAFSEYSKNIGLEETFMTLVDELGGLNDDFRSVVKNSIDVDSGTFSYSQFSVELKTRLPTFTTILMASNVTSNEEEKRILSSVDILSKVGSDNLLSIQSLTNVIKFIDTAFITFLYVQNPEKFKEEVGDNIDEIFDLESKQTKDAKSFVSDIIESLNSKQDKTLNEERIIFVLQSIKSSSNLDIINDTIIIGFNDILYSETDVDVAVQQMNEIMERDKENLFTGPASAQTIGTIESFLEETNEDTQTATSRALENVEILRQE